MEAKKRIPLHKVFMPDEVIEELKPVLKSGWIGEGPQTAKFEEKLRKFLKQKKITALNSGTSALIMALRLAEIKYNDEIITTPMTCMATNEPILLAGAIPVWSDVHPDSGNIDVESIRKKITIRTKAIMIVHWGGAPCDLDPINELAKEYNLKVIEDAAHALGSKYKGKFIGNHSDYVAFSFQAIKHITTGDGGAIACRSIKDHMRARSLKWFGIDREKRQTSELGHVLWDIIEPGYKFHMNDIAATIGLTQFKYLNEIIKKRRENAAFYDNAISEIKGLKILKPEHQFGESSYWLYTFLTKGPEHRLKIIRYMREQGIETSIVHQRNDTYKIFKNYNNSDLKGVTEFCDRMLCLPVGQWVGEEERKYIIEHLHKAAKL